jgi:hypothetical protein
VSGLPSSNAGSPKYASLSNNSRGLRAATAMGHGHGVVGQWGVGCGASRHEALGMAAARELSGQREGSFVGGRGRCEARGAAGYEWR